MAKSGPLSACLWAVATAMLIVGIEVGLSDIDTPARRALMIFAVAIVGWEAAPQAGLELGYTPCSGQSSYHASNSPPALWISTSFLAVPISF